MTVSGEFMTATRATNAIERGMLPAIANLDPATAMATAAVMLGVLAAPRNVVRSAVEGCVAPVDFGESRAPLRSPQHARHTSPRERRA
jgi:hypothetical protein